MTRTIDGVPYFLSLTDTAGQEEYRGLWASSNLKSDAFLLVYDITNPNSLETLDYFMQMIDIEAETRADSNAARIKSEGKNLDPNTLQPPPIKIVAGNKCDLKDARVISSRQGLEWARRRGCGFMETSAREMVNIEETFARESRLSTSFCHSNSLRSLVIVRRVVEARRLQTQGPSNPSQAAAAATRSQHGQNHSVSRTQPLSETEKHLSERSEFEKTSARREGKKSFWAKLKCW